MSSEMGLVAGGLLLYLCLINLTNGNLSPEITQTQYTICEDIPEDIPAFTILATDPEGDKLTYSISGINATFFTVEPSNGTVFVKRSLQPVPLMKIFAIVSDSLNFVQKEIYIIIRGANSNKPVFDEASYEKLVPEDTPVGTSLLSVTANDPDSGLAGSIVYSIVESVPISGLHIFSIVSTSGQIRLNQKLNYTLSSSYRIKVNASDRGGKCYFDTEVFHSSTIFAFITVEDIADLDPQFYGTPYLTTVEENTPIGQSVFTVTAIDPDTGINDKIVYSIQSSTVEGLFSIDQEGMISVNNDIDRETVGDTVVLTIKATETSLNIHGVHASATAEVKFTIRDLNDNKPEFYKCADTDCEPASSFTGEVKEHSLGAVSINMMVKDADKNARTELSLDGPYKDIFTVEPSVVFSESVVQLVVKQPEELDFETIQQLSVKVIAVDQENITFRSTADVTINIIDVNDHSPVFEKETYFAEVPEHCSDDTPVITITAQDPDTMDQNKITYRLLPDSIRLYFDVEPTTGDVFVKNGSLLDREARALYSATLQARDSDGKPGSTVLEITVTDINDEKPIPNRQSYEVFVPEGGNLENVKIEATDGDEPGTPNSQLVFRIEPGPFSENFTIDPNTGVLTNKGPLDREDIDPKLDGRIELNVIISDNGDPPLSNVVKVIIHVQDINDNKPVFGNLGYNFTVKEGQKGAFVGTVYAIDHDQTTEFNRISFTIINGGFGSFTIRTVENKPGYNGSITVDQDIELDYESSQHFTLQVEAADREQEKAEIMVDVYVLDVNDERPVFQPIKPVEVEENSKETGPIGRFYATDKDGNHSLVYSVLSVKCRCNRLYESCKWFTVEPNGEVKINPEATIDYESCDQAIVEARVMDEYTEKGEAYSASPGEMEINIVDINDNTPEFIYSNSLFVVVSESASKGTSVAGVSATDRDSGVNSQIEFQVSKVQFNDINNITTDKALLFEAITTQQKDIYVGIIQSTAELDTKLKGKYLVTVVAEDTGGLSNTTILEIFVVDESFKIELGFASPTSAIEAQKPELVRDLTAATQAAVHIVAIKSIVPDSSRESAQTVMELYFVYPNGTALPSPTVMKLLSSPEHFLILSKYGLIYVGTVDQGGQKVNPVLYVLFGLVGGLIIVTAVLTTSLLCTRRNYRRKLRAANAMKSASAVSANQRGGPVVPGTNLYTNEGANPVLNLNIDTASPLYLDEESDVDKVSLNSLDDSNDLTVCVKDTKPIMQKNHKEHEEKEDKSPLEYIEPLGAALAQRDQKISSNNPLLGDTNPVFNTTDL